MSYQTDDPARAQAEELRAEEALAKAGIEDVRRLKAQAALDPGSAIASAGIVLTGDAQDDPAAYRAFHEAHREKLEPTGVIEESIVGTVALSTWRLMRSYHGHALEGAAKATRSLRTITASQDNERRKILLARQQRVDWIESTIARERLPRPGERAKQGDHSAPKPTARHTTTAPRLTATDLKAFKRELGALLTEQRKLRDAARVRDASIDRGPEHPDELAADETTPDKIEEARSDVERIRSVDRWDYDGLTPIHAWLREHKSAQIQAAGGMREYCNALGPAHAGHRRADALKDAQIRLHRLDAAMQRRERHALAVALASNASVDQVRSENHYWSLFERALDRLAKQRRPTGPDKEPPGMDPAWTYIPGHWSRPKGSHAAGEDSPTWKGGNGHARGKPKRKAGEPRQVTASSRCSLPDEPEHDRDD